MGLFSINSYKMTIKGKDVTPSLLKFVNKRRFYAFSKKSFIELS